MPKALQGLHSGISVNSDHHIILTQGDHVIVKNSSQIYLSVIFVHNALPAF